LVLLPNAATDPEVEPPLDGMFSATVTPAASTARVATTASAPL
jgi:hypothetical protein